MTAPPARGDVGTFPATRDGIRAALDALGHTPTQVAASLDRAGYVGEPGECTRCPVAVYLLGTLDPATLQPAGLLIDPVAVGDTTVTVLRADAIRHEVDLPESVSRFIAAFDLGGYAFLLPAGYIDPEAPTEDPDTAPDTGPDTVCHTSTDTADTSADMAPDMAPDTDPTAGLDTAGLEGISP